MKKFKILLLFTLILFPIHAFATTNTTDRNTLDNLGVNKKWVITDKNRSNVLNSKKVDASEKIYDFADLFTESEEQDIYRKIEEFISKNNADLVILTDKFGYSYDSQNEDYAVDFYDYNDFGLDYEKYDGIILFINMNESNRYVNFYLFGNSQLYFDNVKKNEPITGMLSYLKSGNYTSAVKQFIDYCDRYYDEGVPYDLEGYYVDDYGYLQKDPNFVRKKPPYKAPWAGIIGADFTIILITMIILVKKNKMVKKKLRTMDYVDKKTFKLTKQKDNFVRSYVTSHVISSNSGGGSHGGGGFSSSSGSSGGGHSSGGGAHF